MDPLSLCPSCLIFCLALLVMCRGVVGTTFTFVNSCEYTVWPGILANAGSPVLESTGFELPKGSSRTLEAPTGWSGRFWGRTGCSFDGSGQGNCKTGDCGSGQVECDGAGAAPPATLAEFTLGTGSQDFYDVSLVDGYNLPVLVEVKGGLGTCASTGCSADLNRRCPSELKVDDGEACRSACEAFGNPEYCCSGAYSTPNTCKPSVYSEIFKSACPRSYSYAYDDASSTFTCTGADYTLTFCPSYSNSQKSSRDSAEIAGAGTTAGSVTSGSGYEFVSGSESEPAGESESGSEAVMLANGSWLAGLATGGTTRVISSSALQFTAIAFVIAILSFSHFNLSYSWL